MVQSRLSNGALQQQLTTTAAHVSEPCHTKSKQRSEGIEARRRYNGRCMQHTITTSNAIHFLPFFIHTIFTRSSQQTNNSS